MNLVGVWQKSVEVLSNFSYGLSLVYLLFYLNLYVSGDDVLIS